MSKYRYNHQPDVLILPERLSIVTEWRKGWNGQWYPAKVETGEVGMALVVTRDLKGRHHFTFMQPDELRKHVVEEDAESGDAQVFVHEVRRVKPPLPAHAVAQTTK